jgi:hypothetical protein
MAAGYRFQREDNITTVGDVERGGDYSNESDDSSERARYPFSYMEILIGKAILKGEVITILDQQVY